MSQKPKPPLGRRAGNFLVRSILVSAMLTLFVEAYLQPKIDPGLLFDVGFAFSVQLVALLATAVVVPWAKAGVQVLAVSFLFAVFVTVVLVPSNSVGYAMTFFVVLVIETIGMIVSHLIAPTSPRTQTAR